MKDNRHIKKPVFPLKFTINQTIGLVVAVFVLIFAVLAVILPDRTYSEKENRTLESLPSFSMAALDDGRFTSSMDSYVADQFPLRDFWIKVRSFSEGLLGRYYSNGVYKGGDGYLIEETVEPSTKSIRDKADSIKDFKDRISQDREVLMLMVPNAASVLSDDLPKYADIHDQTQDISTLASYMNEYGVEWMDVSGAFDYISQSDSNLQLFYRNDHHWTTDAAYMTFRWISGSLGISTSESEWTEEVLSNDFKGTLASKSGFSSSEPDVIRTWLYKDDIDYVVENADTGEKSTSVYCTDKLDTVDKYAVFLGGNYARLNITTTVDTDRKLLMIKDSYANCFVPFLIPYYSEIIMIDPRYYSGDIYSLIDFEDVDQVLIMYNANTFFEDTMLISMMEYSEE